MQVIKTSYENVIELHRGENVKVKYWHEGKMETNYKIYFCFTFGEYVSMDSMRKYIWKHLNFN